jgi:hypothetical protein
LESPRLSNGAGRETPETANPFYETPSKSEHTTLDDHRNLKSTVCIRLVTPAAIPRHALKTALGADTKGNVPMSIRKNNITTAALFTAFAAGGSAYATTPDVVVNEANCVSNTQRLDSSESDEGFVDGRFENNAKDWIELLVTENVDCQDGVDMRGWMIEWRFNKDQNDADVGHGAIIIRDVTDSPLKDVRTGMLITLFDNTKLWWETSGGDFAGGENGLEGQYDTAFNSSIHTLRDFTTDTSFNPENTSKAIDGSDGDWSLILDASAGASRGSGTTYEDYEDHIEAGNPSGYETLDLDGKFVEGTYFAFIGALREDTGGGPGTFEVENIIGDTGVDTLYTINNDDWEVRILKPDGMSGFTVVHSWVGEEVASFGGGGVGKDEVLKQEGNDGTNYDNGDMFDGDDSTAGLRNEWANSSGIQDLSDARDWWSSVLKGDANLDGVVDQTDEDIVSANNFTASGADWFDGDFDGDGDVDNDDEDWATLTPALGGNRDETWTCP